jgi:hypothetical protein
MRRDKGRTIMPNTKISAKIGPVTPAEWTLTFQNLLMNKRIIVTKV